MMSTEDFFHRHLRSNYSFHIRDEYPLVFQQPYAVLRWQDGKLTEEGEGIDCAASWQCFLQDGDGPQAGLVALWRELEVQKEVWKKALFIGSVVTDPDQRGQGLQRELFKRVEEQAKTHGAELLVLWSNQKEFYEKLGFSLGGLQVTWSVTHQRSLVSESSYSVRVKRSIEQDLLEGFYEAFSKKSCRPKRSFEEMKKLWQIPEMQVAFTDQAYALVGKGADFQGVCHEWAGPAKEVLACFDAFRSQQTELSILTPGVVHENEELKVTQALENSLSRARFEYLAFFKNLNSEIDPKGLDPNNLQYPFFIWGLDSI